MGNLLEGASTVEELFQQTIEDRENSYVHIDEVGESLGTQIVEDEITIVKKDDEIGKITVWKKYEVLLFALNNLFYAIDEHFNSIGRTEKIDPDLIKNICTEIFNQHKAHIDSENE